MRRLARLDLSRRTRWTVSTASRKASAKSGPAPTSESLSATILNRVARQHTGKDAFTIPAVSRDSKSSGRRSIPINKT